MVAVLLPDRLQVAVASRLSPFAGRHFVIISKGTSLGWESYFSVLMIVTEFFLISTFLI